ncbi:MAG TPA: hypothetical protein VLA24_09500 [Pseudomonadales bacterium]|nr:hypothetical protein [Pseudomonadales bacterium]
MSAFDVYKWLDAGPIALVKGAGHPKTGGCWMSAISRYAGEQWTDHPECVCPVIRNFCILINDLLPSDAARGRVIGPRLFDPIGTRGSLEAMELRAVMLLNACVRMCLPIAVKVNHLDYYYDFTRFPESPSFPGCTVDTVITLHAVWRTLDQLPYTPMQSDATYVALCLHKAACYIAGTGNEYASCRVESLYRAAGHVGTAYETCLGAGGGIKKPENMEDWIVQNVMPVFDQMVAIGSKTPIELSCSERDLDCAVQRF